MSERPWVCEWPLKKPCPRKVVAIVGLPSARAIQVCREHFDAYQRVQGRG